jgi:hypothetical protein
MDKTGTPSPAKKDVSVSPGAEETPKKGKAKPKAKKGTPASKKRKVEEVVEEDEEDEEDEVVKSEVESDN